MLQYSGIILNKNMQQMLLWCLTVVLCHNARYWRNTPRI